MQLAVDTPDVQAFVNTLPGDPERDRRGDLLWTSAETFTAALARKQELQSLLEQIAAVLVYATGNERERLLTERSTVASEISTFPVTVRIVTARFANALASWESYVHRQEMRVQNDAVDLIEAHATQRRELIDKHTRLGNGGTRFADKAPGVRAEYDALQATLRPAHQRREQARDVAHAIEVELRRRFGESVRYGTVVQRFIDRFVAGVTMEAA